MTSQQLHILRPAILIGIGVLMALSASSLASFSDPSPNAAAANVALTATFAPPAASQAGSTDWITLMGVIIVLIVIVPIIFRSHTGTK